MCKIKKAGLIVSFFAGLISCKGTTDFTQNSDEEVKVYFSSVNKTQFQKFEPIIIDLIIENNSDKNICICEFYHDFINTDLNVSVREIAKYINGSYDRPIKSTNIDSIPNRGCDQTIIDESTISSIYKKTIIPPNTKYHMPFVVSALYDFDRKIPLRGIGLYDGLYTSYLPSGNYKFKVRVFQENGYVLGKETFLKILDTDLDYMDIIKNFTAILYQDKADIKPNEILVGDKNVINTPVLDFYRAFRPFQYNYKDIVFFYMILNSSRNYYYAQSKANNDFLIQEISKIKDINLVLILIKKFIYSWSFKKHSGIDKQDIDRLTNLKKVYNILKQRGDGTDMAFKAYIVGLHSFKNIYQFKDEHYIPDSPLSQDEIIQILK